MVLERLRPRRGLIPWRPFREMDEMERLFESSFANWPLRMTWRRAPGAQMGWAPSIDMYEKEDSFILRVELPGVNKEDVDISMTEDTLTIKGERKPPEEAKEFEYQCSEVCYGTFSRSIDMPTPVNSDKIDATYHNGMLEIRLQKVKEAVPARIQITAK